MLDFATEIGWWLSLVPAHVAPEGQTLNFRGHDAGFRFSPEDYPKLAQLISRLKEKKRQGKLLFDSDEYLNSVYHFITTGSPSWRHDGVCDSPNLYFAILPDGRFAPCCDFRIPETLYLYDPDFPRVYRSRPFRQQVPDVVSRCPGCNFGSFPEMTLSARSPSTIVERVRLQLRAGSHRFPALGEEELFGIVDRLTASNPIYPRTIPPVCVADPPDPPAPSR